MVGSGFHIIQAFSVQSFMQIVLRTALLMHQLLCIIVEG